MPNKSKTKGSNAERELCSILNKVFNETFIRTPNSGAYIGGLQNVRAKYLSENQKQIMANDIIPPTCFPKCAIECKFYQEFDFHHLFRTEGNNILNKWIKQVEESGVDINNSFPMICFKINRKGWFVCLWHHRLTEDYDLNLIPISHYKFDNKCYIITDLELFLNTYKEQLINSFSTDLIV